VCIDDPLLQSGGVCTSSAYKMHTEARRRHDNPEHMYMHSCLHASRVARVLLGELT
jgi:hypothetical protein